MSILKEQSRKFGETLATKFTGWKTPEVYLQFGTGFELDGLFDGVPQAVSSAEFEGMPAACNPDGELPEFLYGTVSGVSALACKGHRHLYEGLGVNPCVLPLCGAVAAGVRKAILIEGAVSLNRDIRLGSWALLTDFINGHGISPLDGNHDMLEDPFPDMSCALSQELNSALVNAFVPKGIQVKLGVYHSRAGSQFCTPSEAVHLRQTGADLTGHDLVMEIILGHALGCQVSACVLAAAAEPVPYARSLTRESWRETCGFCSGQLVRGLRSAIS